MIEIARPWAVAILAVTSAATAYGQSGSTPPHHDAPDNGTDPTRLSRSATITYEHTDLLEGYKRDLFRLEGIVPFGQKNDWSARVRVPVVSTDTTDDDGYGLGDASLQLSHVFGMTHKRGFVAQGEFTFDTAERDELGGGQTIFKGTLIYAKFLEHGIFAPAFVQTLDVGGGSDRPDVRTTTIDFYYVPKLAGGKYVTFDPALNYDWERNQPYASLATTFGKVVGPAFGGHGQVYLKPSLQMGPHRPSDWAIEVGYKVIGF